MADSPTPNDNSLDAGMEFAGGAGRRRFEARPLNSEERARAEQLAGRLQAELRQIVEDLPEHARNATGMSRFLNIVRNTCQRIVSSVSEPHASASLLGRLPGVEGLNQFLDAVGQVGVSKADLGATRAAVEQFHSFLREVGGSQSRLAARLSATADPDAAARREDPIHAIERYRKHLFTGAALVTGRQADVQLDIKIYRVDIRGDVANVMHGEAYGWIGGTARPGAAPFYFGTEYRSPQGDDQNQFSTLLDKTVPVGDTPSAVLQEFSSNPPPRITTRNWEARTTYIIDPAEATPANPLDVVTGVRSNIPMKLIPGKPLPAVRSAATLVEVPARHLVMDVYLHREMASRLLPSFEYQTEQPKSSNPNLWVTALPNSPRLELLGQGLGQAETPVYPRHRDLTQYLFDRLGWEPSEFIGYRCSIAYPIWRVYHTVFFRPLQ